MFLDQLSRYDDFIESRRCEIEKEGIEDNALLIYGKGMRDAIVKVWDMVFECGLIYKESSN